MFLISVFLKCTKKHSVQKKRNALEYDLHPNNIGLHSQQSISWWESENARNRELSNVCSERSFSR